MAAAWRGGGRVAATGTSMAAAALGGRDEVGEGRAGGRGDTRKRGGERGGPKGGRRRRGAGLPRVGGDWRAGRERQGGTPACAAPRRTHPPAPAMARQVGPATPPAPAPASRRQANPPQPPSGGDAVGDAVLVVCALAPLAAAFARWAPEAYMVGGMVAVWGERLVGGADGGAAVLRRAAAAGAPPFPPPLQSPLPLLRMSPSTSGRRPPITMAVGAIGTQKSRHRQGCTPSASRGRPLSTPRGPPWAARPRSAAPLCYVKST